MALKRFNHEYVLIPSGDTGYGAEEEAQLHFLLKDTVTNSRSEDFIDGIQLTNALHHLNQVILKSDPKSGPFGKTVELIEKMILVLKDNKQSLVQNAIFLPILTDILLRSSTRIENILKLIQDVSFGIVIKTCQVFLERLVKFCVGVICDQSNHHDDKIKAVALSVLINLCSKNPISLAVLEQEINLIDLQKKIPLETYGILTCKMNLVLNECGHILSDADVRNFLKYTSKELHRIPSLDEKSLRHLNEFIRDISERSHFVQILQQYDFSLGIKAAIMILENTTDTRISSHTNALLEFIKIIMPVKNESLNNFIKTITSFAIKRLNTPECCIQSLETLTTIFQYDPKISKNNFELEEMLEILNTILLSNEKQSTIMAPVFKLLNVLAKNYKVSLVTNQTIESIFAPLLKLDRSKYFKIPIGDITMYLECLAMLSTLSDRNILDTKTSIFQESNVQFLVAMSTKHGNIEQCSLALSLMNRFPHRDIAEMILSKHGQANDPYQMQQNNQTLAIGKDFSAELGNERVKNVFVDVEKSMMNNKFDVPCSDFITLYTNENAMLRRRIESLTKKYEDLSREINLVNNDNTQHQITAMQWSELTRNLQQTNETLIAENEKLNTIVTSLKTQISMNVNSNKELAQKLGKSSKKLKEMEEKAKALEDELNETEETRQAIMSLMSKRKKQNL